MKTMFKYFITLTVLASWLVSCGDMNSGKSSIKVHYQVMQQRKYMLLRESTMTIMPLFQVDLVVNLLFMVCLQVDCLK